MVNAHNVPFYLWDQVLRGSLARQPWHRYLCIVFVDPRIRPLWVFAPYDSVLGCLCLASRKVLGTYPTQSKMVIFDPQSRGWQSLSGLRLPLPGSADHPRLATLQALPAVVSLPLSLLPLALPRQVPSSHVILQPPESLAAPTQGPELGYHIDKHLAALLVDYQWFRCVLDSGSRPVVPRPSEDLGR
jgi:hypothetical protein